MSHETRPPARPDEVEAALTAAVAAAKNTFPERGLRLDPPDWGAWRQRYHSLGDVERRTLLLAILVDEGHRLHHDRGVR